MKKRPKSKRPIVPAPGATTSAGHSPPWMVACASLFLVLVTFVVFWNGLKGVFISDDRLLNSGLSFLQTLWPLREAAALPGGIAARPILSLTFTLNQVLLGSESWHYRIVNIAIHAVAGLLLFTLVRKTLPRCGAWHQECGTQATEVRAPSPIYNSRAAMWIAFATTLLWLVHPLQTASVTYLIQRAESLAGLCLLLTLYAAIRRFEGGGRGWTILAVAVCVLGMGVKQTMFPAPILVLLYDYTFMSGSVRNSLRAYPGLYAGMAVGWVLLGAITVITQAADPWPEFGARNPLPYALSQPGVILYYLRLTFWPEPIVMLYGWPYADTAPRIVPPLLVVGLLAGLTLWGLRKRSWIGFLGAWFFLILAPSSSIVAEEQVIQCQRMYLALAAVLLLSVAGAYAILGWSAPRIGARQKGIIGIVLLALVATALAWGTIRRNRTYSDELTFWKDNVARQPQSRAALSALGSELIIRSEKAASASEMERIMREAETCFRKALQVNDSHRPVEVHFYLGFLALRSGRLDEALSHYRASLALRPYHAGTVEKIGVTLAALGQKLGDTPAAKARCDEAIQYFEKALSMQPEPYVAANAHNNIATILSQQGRLEEAAAHYRLAIQQKPDWPQAYGNLGSTLIRMGRFDEALAPFETALRLRPNNADVHNNLGSALLGLKRYQEAIGHFREALRINPNHAMAQENLQLALAAGANSQGS